MTSLLPCPFCGKPPTHTNSGGYACDNELCPVICGVPAEGFDPKHDPLKAWNTRAAPVPQCDAEPVRNDLVALANEIWADPTFEKIYAALKSAATPPSRSDAECAKPFTTEQLDALQFGRLLHERPNDLTEKIARIDALLAREDEDSGYSAFVFMRKLWPMLKMAALRPVDNTACCKGLAPLTECQCEIERRAALVSPPSEAGREALIHTICPHIKQWSDGEDVVDKTCKKCPATVETSQGTGVQMCRLNAEAAADAVLALSRSDQGTVAVPSAEGKSP